MTEFYEPQSEKVYVDKQKVDMFLMTNQKYFPAEKIVFLREKLYAIDETKFTLMSAVELKDPTTMLLISLFLGAWGVDRFMMKDTGMGILKLLTGGCCGVLTIIDWCSIQKKTREQNFNNIMTLL
ncbi:MAG: TM2 domain-containing protein [Ruminococcaceae bacterium]|nr:TM2 domain-containing protein [Oscillospiraceae bacterium]